PPCMALRRNMHGVHRNRGGCSSHLPVSSCKFPYRGANYGWMLFMSGNLQGVILVKFLATLRGLKKKAKGKDVEPLATLDRKSRRPRDNQWHKYSPTDCCGGGFYTSSREEDSRSAPMNDTI
ncbi:hypothetical protein OIU85_017818, partial [Salix viminalis]